MRKQCTSSFSDGVTPEILVIIPARGGSKGVPRKNIVDIGGKPLIAYSIEAALESRYVSRVVVTTDSGEIAAVAKQYGAEVPFLRPEQLAGDNSALQDVTNHCIATLAESGYRAEVHCIMLPPHMFRQPRLLNEAVELILSGWHNVYTVRRIPVQETRYFQPGEGGTMREMLLRHHAWPAPPQYYRMYGNISVFAPGLPTVGAMPIVLTNPIELIDIDTPEDVELAREVVRLNLYDFEAT